MKRLLSGAAILAALIGSRAATQPIHSANLLLRAREATCDTSYQGRMFSRVLMGNHWVDSQIMAYYHPHDMSRMEYLSGPMKGVIIGQWNAILWREDPASGKVALVQGSPAESDTSSLLRSNYAVQVGPRETLANRSVLQVDAIPHAPGTPRRRYWIDQRTGVILGWEQWRADGDLQSISQFESVSFRPEPESLFEPPRNHQVEVSPLEMQHSFTLSQIRKQVPFPVTMPRWIPPGYHFMGNYLTRCGSNKCRFVMTRITDGMNDLYLFQGRHHDEDATPAERTSGPGPHLLRAVRGDLTYVLVGALNQASLQRILSSIG